MPITPPPDNKQEQPSYSTDPVGPDLDKDALVRLLKKYPRKAMIEAIERQFPGRIEKVLSEVKDEILDSLRWEGEPDVQIFDDPARETHGVWPVFKSKYSMDEIKENFENLDSFSS